MSIALSMLHDRDRVNIVEPGRLHPAVSFARASTATYMGPAGTLLTAAVNAPRYEYDNLGNYLGLLIEEARTNLETWSQDYTNAAWGKTNVSVTAGASVAPDGTTTGQTITESAATGIHRVQQSRTVTSGSTYTVSIIAKAGARNWIILGEDSAGQGAFFDLSAGVIGAVNGTGTVATMSSLGSGWYRCTVSYPQSGTVGRAYCGLSAGNGGAFPSYAGDGTSGISAWGFQYELGAFATSYIPTTGAAATRSADVAQITDLTKIGFNSAAGTLIARIDALGSDTLTRGIAGLSTSARLLYSNTNNFLTYNIAATASRAGPVVGTMFNIATSYGSHLAAATLGAAWASGASATGMAGSTLFIGSLSSGGNVYAGHIQRLAYLPRQLPDVELGRNAP